MNRFSHILKVSAFAVMYLMIVLNSAFAVIDLEKNLKIQILLPKKKVKSTDKEEAKISISTTKVKESNISDSIIPYHQFLIEKITLKVRIKMR